MKNRTKKLISMSVSLLLVAHILLLYALPIKMFLVVFFVITIFFLFIEWQNIIIVSISTAFATLVFWGFLSLPSVNESFYYRPHEIFRIFDNDIKYSRYEKNVSFEMDMPHGDLKAMALYANVTPEPRKVSFHTDSLGLRNSKNYHGQNYLLVGDSFIVGNGTTQNEIITHQLLKKYNFDSYNLAFPGSVKDYINNVKVFEETFKNHEFKVILFLFEGNDFPLSKEKKSLHPFRLTIFKTAYIKKIHSYYKIFNKTNIYRFMFSQISRYSLKKKYKNMRVDTRMIEGIPIAFNKDYISVSERSTFLGNPEIEQGIKSIKNKIAHIYFIPTKYRVYYNSLSRANLHKTRKLPHKQWELLQRISSKYNIRVTDLTPALIDESNNLLKKRKLTFWKDDTHWNKNGISVAAKIIVKNIAD